MTRTEPFPAPDDPANPDIGWAMRLFDEWLDQGRPELDGSPAEQWKIAMAVIRGEREVTR